MKLDKIVVIDDEECHGAGIKAEKSLTLAGAISLIVGSIIGTGLFANGGHILKYAGSPGMAMIVWTFGSLVAFAGGLSYAEWGLMIPESGGDLPYLEFIYRKPRQFASFLFCFCRVILIHTGETAALCTIVGKYAMSAINISFGDEENMKQLWTEKAIGLAALISVWLLTAFSNTIATRAGTYITLIKVILVLFVIATGIAAGVGAIASPYKPLPSPSNFASIQRSFEGTATDPGAYATALYMVFFCYDGWSMLSTSVGELKDPVRNIPKAMLMGMSGIAVLYLGVNLSYFLVLSREQMVESGDLLAFVWADAVFGPVFSRIMAAIILTSAYGAILCITFGASRVVAESAQPDRRFLPWARHLASLHPRWATPFWATTFHCCVSALIILITVTEDSFVMLVEITGYPAWIFYGFTLGGLVLARYSRRTRDFPRKFRVWLICPLSIVITSIFLSIFPFFNGLEKAIPAAVGLGTILLGALLYFFTVYRRK